MARIAGIDLPREKRIEIGLTYIYGIGRTSANKILAEAGINPDTRVKDLTEEDEAKLREVIGHSYVVEGDLRRNVATSGEIEVPVKMLVTCARTERPHGALLQFGTGIRCCMYRIGGRLGSIRHIDAHR